MVEFLELARLRQYLAEFERLIAVHDRAPAQWQYFQTQWLWLYVRGMIAGKYVDDVRAQRLAELDGQTSAEAVLEQRRLRESAVVALRASTCARPKTRSFTLGLVVRGSEVRFLFRRVTRA